jgi:hypothetical protein
MFVGEVAPEVFRVNFDGTESAENTEPQKAAEGASR